MNLDFIWVLGAAWLLLIAQQRHVLFSVSDFLLTLLLKGFFFKFYFILKKTRKSSYLPPPLTHTHILMSVGPLLAWMCLLGVVKPLVPRVLLAATLNWYQRPGRMSPSLARCSVVWERWENPHHLRTEENTDNNLSARTQSVTNHSGRVTSSWVRGRPAHLCRRKWFLFIYSVCSIYF